MATGLVFGDTSPRVYTFGNIQSVSSTFGDMVAQTVRMPAIDGGFDVYGDMAAPKSVGDVRVTFKLFSSTRAGMTTARRAVAAMLTWGVQKLILQPSDALADTVYCYARVNNINMAQRPADNTDFIQVVSVNFQVADPYWRLSTATSTDVVASGLTTSATVTNNGNANALPIITIAPDTSDTCENPEIRRVDGSGNILDAIGYTGILDDTDTLIINCQTGAITLNGVDAWSDKNETNTTHPDWLRLLPGANSIRVIFANMGDAADVNFSFEDTFN